MCSQQSCHTKLWWRAWERDYSVWQTTCRLWCNIDVDTDSASGQVFHQKWWRHRIRMKDENGNRDDQQLSLNTLAYNKVWLATCIVVSRKSAHWRKSSHLWKSAHPLYLWANFLYRVKVYSNERPPWSELHVEFEKHSLKSYAYLT